MYYLSRVMVAVHSYNIPKPNKQSLCSIIERSNNINEELMDYLMVFFAGIFIGIYLLSLLIWAAWIINKWRSNG